MRQLIVAVLSVWWLSAAAPAAGQTMSADDYRRNLEACRGGIDAACYRSLLTPSDRVSVEAAVADRNAVACRLGYSTCRRALLPASEVVALDEAAYRANYNGCRFSSAPCRWDALTAVDREEIETLFYNANVAACEARAASCRPEKLKLGHPLYSAIGARLEGPSAAPVAQPTCVERDDCASEVAVGTGRPKTVFVRGYYRKDGVYVRPYRRSKPR